MRKIIWLPLSLILILACNGPTKITQKGLAYARLGEQMPTKGLTELAGLSARDTLYDEGGFQWRALILNYGNGEVFIEEDFGQQGLINRIRIETPSLKASKNRLVGMSWSALLPMKNNWDAIYLVNYGVWDVVSASQNRIHYLLEEKRDTASFDWQGGINSIPTDANVKAIVVM